MRTLLLDNEAVGALADPLHSKHRTVLAHLSGVVTRRKRGTAGRVAVATAVRVEAGWDRSAPQAAAINRLRVTDVPLDSSLADVAAAILRRTHVSVADAHTGAAIRSLAGQEVVVLTSDPDDMIRMVTPQPIAVVRL